MRKMSCIKLVLVLISSHLLCHSEAFSRSSRPNPGLAFKATRNEVPRHSYSVLSLSSISSVEATSNMGLQMTSTSTLAASAGAVADAPTSTTMRDRLRNATGFSLTLIRGSLRKSTGFSLTLLQETFRLIKVSAGFSLSTSLTATTVAATNNFVRKTMALVLRPLPLPLRYFVQPFLLMYYSVLVTIRGWSKRARKVRLEMTEELDKKYCEAVDFAASRHDGDWPVVVNEKGEIVSTDPDDDDIVEGIMKSMDYFIEETNKED